MNQTNYLQPYANLWWVALLNSEAVWCSISHGHKIGLWNHWNVALCLRHHPTDFQSTTKYTPIPYHVYYIDLFCGTWDHLSGHGCKIGLWNHWNIALCLRHHPTDYQSITKYTPIPYHVYYIDLFCGTWDHLSGGETGKWKTWCWIT